ncbi:cytochrome c oxidase subunit 5A, mitochondrial-like [Sycon ciliatum]|uniref:cytochrome c oxidase subunit 5A, mitochondrial-like n=1 Tax=Sycon ciliatum TaxID=27933 RepID=UPI0020AEAA80|eukprot:scpid79642/ scgid12676/ Cytochrome c oxidase subunit 5A, mitochondrial; Cytochrome c oxidase polypeptide Va
MLRLAVNRLFPAATTAVARTARRAPSATALVRHNTTAATTAGEKREIIIDGKPFNPDDVTETDPVVPDFERPEEAYYMPSWILIPNELNEMTPEEFDQAFLTYFQHEDCDRFMCRKGIRMFFDCDVIPEPEILKAMLDCCRRNDDVTLAVRIMEVWRTKCEHYGKDYWPYLYGEVAEYCEKLGIPTLEELGIEKADPDRVICW